MWENWILTGIQEQKPIINAFIVKLLEWIWKMLNERSITGNSVFHINSQLLIKSKIQSAIYIWLIWFE